MNTDLPGEPVPRPRSVDPAENSTVVNHIGEKTGDRIGRYKLLEKIGEGGFGVVFTAEQLHPVRRKVAIKVIKLGMDTREVVARFEAERQALAMMDHPNIAKVLDAGSTDTGRPYFVMELVRGSAVTDYADKHRLVTTERVALVAQICRAVQHAHSKGVIHRDIKPGNVLVTVTDDRPVPKVIDFGIAKATQTRLTERTLYTAHRQLIGTPQYMSPEQADSDGSDIDTRTDVFSLGVLLYELMVGITPHDPWVLRTATYDEMRKLICNTDIPHPSARLHTIPGDNLDTVADNRSSDLKKLNQSVKGELDWIVMKALEKDRTRRYDTAAAMADDLQRYLTGEPVLAGPVGHLYRMQKMAFRYRLALSVAATLIATLALATGGITWALVRESQLRATAVAAEKKATEEAAMAVAEKTNADLQKTAALAAENAAVQQSKAADAVVAFLTDTFALASPQKARDDSVSRVLVESLIEPAARTIDQRFESQPMVKAKVQLTLARTLFDLGRYDLAIPLTTSAWDIRRNKLGDNAPETIAAMVDYANNLSRTQRVNESLEVCRSALDQARRTLGDDHPSTMEAMNSYAAALFAVGRQPEAAALFKQAWEQSSRLHGDDDQTTITEMMNYGVALDSLGQHAEAAEVGKRVWEQRRRSLGDDHPDTIGAMDNYGNELIGMGRFGEAADITKQSWDRERQVKGDNHPDTIRAMNNYGGALLSLGRFTEAADVLSESWKHCRAIQGDNDPSTIAAMVNYGVSLTDLGRNQEAEPILRQAIEMLRHLYPDHPFRGIALYNLGRCLIAQSKWPDAETVLRENLDWDQSHHGSDIHRKIPGSFRLLNQCLKAQGKPEEPLPTTQPATTKAVPANDVQQ